MAFVSQEDLQKFLAMPDLTDQERQMLMQQQYAEALRRPILSGGAKPKDWASQAARGLQGVMSGYQNMQAGKTGEGLSGAKRGFLKDMFGGGEKRPEDYIGDEEY